MDTGQPVAGLERQFHGTVLLAVLHLRKLARSNDIDEGFAAAREFRMIDEEQERFMRSCLELDEKLQAHGTPRADGVVPAQPTHERLERLRACIRSINSADPA